MHKRHFYKDPQSGWTLAVTTGPAYSSTTHYHLLSRLPITILLNLAFAAVAGSMAWIVWAYFVPNI